jgi:hypothetical protein
VFFSQDSILERASFEGARLRLVKFPEFQEHLIAPSIG